METYTAKMVGCWADGAMGRDRVRARMARMVEACGASWELVDALLSAVGLLGGSEEQEALDLLNEHCVGCHFELAYGDLVLLAD
jgi:hypothetical protein